MFTDAAACGTALNGDPGGFDIQGAVLATAGGGHTDWVANGVGTNCLLTSGGVPLDSTVTYRRLDPYTGLDDSFHGGTDKFKGSSRFYATDKSLESQNITDAQRAQGASSGNPIQNIKDYGIEVGGPRVIRFGARVNF